MDAQFISQLSDKVLAKFAQRAPGAMKVLQALPETGAHGVPREQLVASFQSATDAVIAELATRGVKWQGVGEES